MDFKKTNEQQNHKLSKLPVKIPEQMKPSLPIEPPTLIVAQPTRNQATETTIQKISGISGFFYFNCKSKAKVYSSKVSPIVKKCYEKIPVKTYARKCNVQPVTCELNFSSISVLLRKICFPVVFSPKNPNLLW